MSELALVGLLFTMSQDFGPAPKNTLDPEACVKRFCGIFHNCSFAGTQRRESKRPAGTNFMTIWDVVGKGCEDAVVVQYKETIKQTNSRVRQTPDSIKYRELRWLKNERWIHIDCSIKVPNCWPIQPIVNSAVTVDTVTVYPKWHRDRVYAWEEILVSDFAGEVDKAGLTFADMVAEGGQFGYRFDKAVWSSVNHTQVTYYFISPEYGTTVVTFAKQADRDWMPILIHLIRSHDHKIAPDNLVGPHNQALAPNNRVGNFRKFKDFSEPAQGLDRLETIFQINYSTKPSGNILLPTSLKRTEIRYFKKERSLITTLLEFSELKCGNVSCDEVLKTMLEIPNETKVYVLEPEYRNIDMVWIDGKPVKRIDAEAVFIGRSAQFSTRTTRVTLFVTVASLALIVGIYLLRSRVLKAKS